jgi:chromosome segregation ATPase
MQTMAPPDEVLKERFNRTDERILNVDRRVAEAAKATDRRFEEINQRSAEAARETNRRLKEVDRRLTEVDRRLTESREDTDERFKEVNRRIDANTAELRSFKQEIRAFHSTFQRGNYILVATMVGAILTLLIKGG